MRHDTDEDSGTTPNSSNQHLTHQAQNFTLVGLGSSLLVLDEHGNPISKIPAHEDGMESPEKLAGYNDALPGGAERAFAMAERQALHRQSMESRRLWFDGIKECLGGVAMLVIVLFGLGLGAWLTAKGKPVEALFSGATALTTASAMWLHKQRKQKRANRKGRQRKGL